MSDFKTIGGTVRARAATELRDRILTGRLRAGARVDLDEITEEFGTSRTPVREALLELSYEGLVDVTPRSGITVVGITPKDQDMAAAPPNHSPKFFIDESGLLQGTRSLAALAVDFLQMKP